MSNATGGPLDRTRRPLDRMGSIKIKLGILIVATVSVAAVVVAGALRLGWSAMLTVPLAIVAAVVLTQLLARGMTSPLREMTAAAKAMERGDYSRRVRASSADEVGDLARAFNTMATQLEQADQQRRELVANVSHELRTPISALQAVLENLVDGVSRPDPATLRVALGQTERLGRLVTDLLDLSRLDAGSIPLTLDTLPVAELLTDAVAEARIADADVDYVVDVRPPDLALVGDGARLHQLIANLLANAARHSPPAGRVSVRATTGADGAVVIDIVDEGPGIPPEQRAAVFERFITGSAQKGGLGDGGTGLGLAIARWVAQLHGGRIEVADTDRGCDLRVTLPQRARRPQPTS